VNFTSRTAAAGRPVDSLAGLRMFVTDARGARRAMELLYASPQQVNARLPDECAAGSAVLTLAAEDGRTADAPLTIEEAVPGILTPDGIRYGAGAVFAAGGDGVWTPGFLCGANRRCELAPLEKPRLLSLLVGGLPAGAAAGGLRVTLVDRALETAGIEPSAMPGVSRVTARIPAGVRLSGYLTLTVSWREKTSTPVFVWLRQP
jgi:hypothetical protein